MTTSVNNIKNNEGINNANMNNQINREMKQKLNLLFIEGNRQKIDKANIKEAYLKIKKHSYLSTMPMEFITMDKAKDKLNGRTLSKAIIVRKTGEGDATLSNFDIKYQAIKPDEYDQYDGVCVDGQHRSLALQFADMQDQKPTYAEVEIPDTMDILSYVALRNNGKVWKNGDFQHSGISTNSKEIDYILKQCGKRKEEDAFFFSIYTLSTTTLQPKQVKALQQGYKTIEDYRNLQLSTEIIEIGDTVLKEIDSNPILTSDRCNGRFGAALKKFYIENGKNIDALIGVINLLDNEIWEAHFVPKKGQSMEIRAYTDALNSVWAQYLGENKG
ncbi:MAG: hypothetical protein NC212_10885 [Staphylococcus sp.]|nr:hypothetical protein [Staphylococcus sp.]